jgi:hypothetical protein
LNEEGAGDRYKIVESKDKEPIGIDQSRVLSVIVLGASGQSSLLRSCFFAFAFAFALSLQHSFILF